MEFSNAHELFKANALKGINVSFLAAIGGDGKRKLSGGVPTDGPLLGEQFRQIAEEGHSAERGTPRIA